MRSLVLDSLEVRSFRNLARVDAAFGPRFNVVAGDNGQGKTNLLEAVYVLATSKSFRGGRPGDLVAFDASVASLRGVVLEDSARREQTLGLRPGGRLVRIDEKRPPSLAAYAVRTPVVVFHPGEVALSMGPSSERRRLLDRTSLYLRPESMADLESFTRAMKARQRTLETRGTSAPGLEAYETLCARHGTLVMQARTEAAAALAESALAAFARIGPEGLALTVRYEPSAPTDEESFFRALGASRERDLRRGSASVGPHRDELLLALADRGVRGVASQGQHRAVTLSLKAAEIEVIGRARGVRPVLLLDDVSSELDRERTAALFAFLRDQEGQVFLTTTRPELIDTGSEGGLRWDWNVRAGVLSRVS